LSAKLRDSVHIVETLLVAGANVLLKTSKGKTAISIAIENRNTEIVELLLGAGSETPNEMGKISLWESSAKGYYRVVVVLLDKGENVNERVTRGWTCLHIAASNGHAKVVELLLQAGADKMLQDDDGRTALMLAKSRGHQDVVDLLS
jgi:ankyrin repeat protein